MLYLLIIAALDPARDHLNLEHLARKQIRMHVARKSSYNSSRPYLPEQVSNKCQNPTIFPPREDGL
jgi:hypothetical protein